MIVTTKKQTIKVKLKDLKERKSPFEVEEKALTQSSTPKALERKVGF